MRLKKHLKTKYGTHKSAICSDCGTPTNGYGGKINNNDLCDDCFEEREMNNLSEAKVDLRKDYDDMVKIKAKSDKSTGTLYLKGKIVQVWWKTDGLGRKANKSETWTSTTEKDAKENIEDMKERFNE